LPLTYHAGQISVQEEANTRPVADRLASWVGPVGEFTRGADMVLLATCPAGGDLNFVCVSGRAPLVNVLDEHSILLPELPLSLGETGVLAGGLAITMAQRRRARLNGRLLPTDEEGCLLRAAEAFSNCRKYIAPSLALDERLHVGPMGGEPVAYDDAWLRDLLSSSETAFLASISPEGQPDVSHRGGPPGFIQLDAAAGVLSWHEFVGDGMFKSAGNVRATSRLTLLVLDIQTGDAAELSGRGSYRTLRTYKEARSGGLERHDEDFPVQGEIVVELTRAVRLEGFTWPRQRLESATKVTSCSPIEEQSPQ